MKLDRRDCPDWMHIRQWVYLEQTSPRVLLSVLPDVKHNRERHRAEQTASARIPIHPAGVIRQRFPQKFEMGNKCYPCGVHTVRGNQWPIGDLPRRSGTHCVGWLSGQPSTTLGKSGIGGTPRTHGEGGTVHDMILRSGRRPPLRSGVYAHLFEDDHADAMAMLGAGQSDVGNVVRMRLG